MARQRISRAVMCAFCQRLDLPLLSSMTNSIETAKCWPVYAEVTTPSFQSYGRCFCLAININPNNNFHQCLSEGHFAPTIRSQCWDAQHSLF